MKSLLYKTGTVQTGEPARFDMPALQDNFSIGRTVDHIEREAYETGYAAGEKAGFEMGEQKARVLTDKLESLLAEVAALRARIVEELEPQCVELAVALARKIIVRELTTKPDEIVRQTKEAVQKLERTGRITVTVNPMLYDFFMKHKPDLVRVHPDIVIDADPNVPKLGSVVAGPVEDVVTGVDEQLSNLIKDMGNRMSRE